MKTFQVNSIQLGGLQTRHFFLFIIFALISFASVAQNKTVTTKIKVSGNCTMCKMRIESALDVTGIKSANWDTKTKVLEVIYNKGKISEQKIHDIVAAAGHDTEKAKAKDETYAELPYCCLYRDHDHSNIKDEKKNQ